MRCLCYRLGLGIGAIVQSATAAPVNLIQNGGFDNLFANWSAGSNQTTPFPAAFNDGQNLAIAPSNSGQAAWFIRNTNTNYFGTPTQLITGNTAYNGFDGSGGIFWLRQTIGTTGQLASANLNFTYATQSQYSSAARVFQANLVDAANAVIIATMYTFTLPLNEISWNPVSVISLDVTTLMNSFAGQFNQIEFREIIPQYFTGPATFGIDNISLVVEAASVPAPGALALLGLGLFGLGGLRRKKAA
jgi:hypothetical protein